MKNPGLIMNMIGMVLAVFLSVVIALTGTEIYCEHAMPQVALEEPFHNTIAKELSIDRSRAYKAIAILEADSKDLAWLDCPVQGCAWYQSYMDYLNERELLPMEALNAPEGKFTYSEMLELIKRHPHAVSWETVCPLLLEKFATEPVTETSFWSVIEQLFLESQGELSMTKIVPYGVLEEDLYENGSLRVERILQSDRVRDYRGQGDFFVVGEEIAELLDRPIIIWTRGAHVFRIETIDQSSTVTYSNVYIEKITGDLSELTVFIDGCTRKLPSGNAKVEPTYEDGIADLTFTGGTLTRVDIKNDYKRAKVLAVSEEGVELEQYGKLTFSDQVRFYQSYGVVKMETFLGVTVGYDNTRFVMDEDNQVCAAIVTQAVDASNIRVVLKTTDFTSLLHNQVTLSSNDDLAVSYGEETMIIPAGTQQVFTPDSACFENGNRVFVRTVLENKGIAIPSITRALGTPVYKGSIELSVMDGQLVVVNDVLLEDYLVSVVPSEMPGSYGLECAKIQAVCARTFACEQIEKNSYCRYGAHLDDSDATQVYNNGYTNDISTEGIRQTYGEVLKYGEEIAGTYYFSTSCGSTAPMSVWGDWSEAEALAHPYLEAKIVSEEQYKTGSEKSLLDLRDEETFRGFITDWEYPAFEKDFDWFRWKSVVDAETISAVINRNLEQGRISTESPFLLVRQADGSFGHSSEALVSIGNVIDIYVEGRLSGGSIEALVIEAEKATLKVCKQSAIRTILGGDEILFDHKGATGVSNGSMFPSAFFCIDRGEKDGIIQFTIYGGGRAHGVGMSQNGAYAMSNLGYRYDQILPFFYPGTDLCQLHKEQGEN